MAAPPTISQLQDPAYWNAVLATLNHIAGEATRDALSAQKVDPDVAQALRQIYGPTVFQNQYQALVRVAGGERSGLITPPGDVAANVTGVVKAASDCVTLTAMLDYSKVNPTVPTAPNVVKLLPRQPVEDAAINPTPWIIDQFFIIEAPEDSQQCVG